MFKIVRYQTISTRTLLGVVGLTQARDKKTINTALVGPHGGVGLQQAAWGYRARETGRDGYVDGVDHDGVTVQRRINNAFSLRRRARVADSL